VEEAVNKEGAMEMVWIGVDMGTTGVRAVAYRPDGLSRGEASREYPLYTPHPGWAEQDPDEIVAAVREVLREVSSELARSGRKAGGLALSSTFHSFLAYDKELRPLDRLVTWADNRSQGIVAEIKKSGLDLLSIYRRVGCPLHASYPVTKIAWWLRQHPQAAGQRFGSIKDHVFFALTSEWVVDRSIASGSGLYDLFRLRWDDELLRYLGIREECLPAVVPTTYSRPLHAEAARRTGLPAGTPVVIGAGDGVLANVGIGAVNPGQMSATIGTSGAVRILAHSPRTDDKARTWCYNLTDEIWVLGGAISNGGIVLRWLRDNFAGSERELAAKLGVDPYELLTADAGKVPPGSDGLILLPFFLGERAPHWNSNLRGVLFGLNFNHGKAHVIRAVMEGICYSMNSILRALEEVTGTVREIRASGSFIRSELWTQMLADVFDRDLHVPDINQGVAFGAAVLGMVAAGELAGIGDTANLVGVAKSYRPQADAAADYNRLYGIYERVYCNLAESFAEISAYQAEHAESAL
jgi:gluconokinase